MNKKIFIIGFLVMFMIILTGCMWFGEQELPVPAGISTDSLDYEQYASCVTQCNVCESDCMDTVHYNKALNEDNKEICNTITSVAVKSECLNMLLAVEAVSELNKDKCRMLNEEEQQSCLVHVSAEIAIQSQSINKCAESPDVEQCQDIFYKDMALLNNDATYCDNLSGEKKQLCHDSLM